MYDQLMSDGSPNLRWFCDSCEKVITEGSQRTSTQQNDKLDNLILLIEKLMEKYENVEKKLEDKASVDMAKHLDKRMEQMEDKLTQIETELVSKSQSSESQSFRAI